MRRSRALGLRNPSSISINRSALLDWYDANKRDLPWRLTHDPYAVWVSEIMLQQTQVATVIPYFERWMARFPTVEILARAEDQDVLSVWQGLGYYRRCRLLLAGARWVAENGFPSGASDWLGVPGVGRYTAAAISSIALGEPVAVVDGNVERVFARLTGCASAGSGLTKAAWEWAPLQVPADRPGDWNQAMMELGATVCRPRDPVCPLCPLSDSCVAFRDGRQAELPVAAPKVSTIGLHRNALVVVWNGQFGLEQIPGGEWWEGMWRFPMAIGVSVIGTVKHVVTNHKITMDVYLEELDAPREDLRWFTPDELKHLPMPAPQRRALKLAILMRGEFTTKVPSH